MARKIYDSGLPLHLVELVRQGRGAESLAREFEPTAKTIRNCVAATKAAEAETKPFDRDARIRVTTRPSASSTSYFRPRSEKRRWVLRSAAGGEG